MRKILFGTMRCLVVFILLSGILLLLLKIFGLRINTSNSIPAGLWWKVKKPVEKGDYVIFCPPDTPVFHTAFNSGIIDKGFCPAGYSFMMKQVAGIEGDSITINKNGVFVNGKKLPFSKPLLNIHTSVRENYILQANEFLLMTDQNPHSFDSRYFGLIHLKNIEGVIKPLLIKPSIYHQE